MKLEITPEQREAAIGELESFIGPSLTGYPSRIPVDFGGAIDVIMYAINSPTSRSAK